MAKNRIISVIIEEWMKRPGVTIGQEHPDWKTR